MRLLLATNNPGKLAEIRELLDLPGLELLLPLELGRRLETAETGSTYEANARLKAEAACREFGLPALADDSGLEIDSLERAPGVHSARFMGAEASYPMRHAEILRRLAKLRDSDRSARFHCCVALARPGAIPAEVFFGTCAGRIALAPQGTHGFGYDPIFIPDGFSTTLAEMPPEDKNRLSHRAQALARARIRILELLGSQTA